MKNDTDVSTSLGKDGLRVLKIQTVLETIQISRSAMYKLVREGKFPPPIKLYGRAVGWRSDAVGDWIRSRQVADSYSEEA